MIFQIRRTIVKQDASTGDFLWNSQISYWFPTSVVNVNVSAPKFQLPDKLVPMDTGVFWGAGLPLGDD